MHALGGDRARHGTTPVHEEEVIRLMSHPTRAIFGYEDSMAVCMSKDGGIVFFLLCVPNVVPGYAQIVLPQGRGRLPLSNVAIPTSVGGGGARSGANIWQTSP